MIASSLALALALAATQEPTGRDAPPPPLASPSEPLMAYAGEHVAVRYSPGALDRAVHVVRRLDLIVGQLQRWLDIPLPLTALVLDRREWDRAGLTRPYGLPLPVSIGSVAVPAVGDDVAVRKWKTWIGTELPALDGVPISGTAEHASALLLADVLLQVEVCELLLGRSALAQSEPWIRGVAAHLAAGSLWSEFEPSRATQLAMIFERLRGQIPVLLHLEPRRLGQGDPPLETERWLLTEAHYFEGASLAQAAGGAKAWKRLLKGVRAGDALTRALMVEIYPQLGPWLEALPADVSR
jgi:hypothetical protein